MRVSIANYSHPYIRDELNHQAGSPWSAEGIPQSRVAEAMNRNLGKFITVEEYKNTSKEKPFEVIKLGGK